MGVNITSTGQKISAAIGHRYDWDCQRALLDEKYALSTSILGQAGKTHIVLKVLYILRRLF